MLVWSTGGGTQSVAIAWLIKDERLPKPDVIVMADTGNEVSYTWQYTEQYVKPLLEAMGLELHIAPHDLATVDLYGKNGDLLIPAYTATGKLPTYCSSEWKKYVVRRFLRNQGVKECITWIGISLDEIGRLKPSDVAWQKYHWPLCFDVPMTRAECREYVERKGWPTPPRSRCKRCPHQQDSEWLELQENYPEDFKQAVMEDKTIRARDPQQAIFLHRSRKPLDQVIFKREPEKPDGLFGPIDGCDSGFCMN